MAYKIKIDQACCIGCGSCVAICPEIFELKDDGKSHLKKEEIENPGCAQQAVEACPASCIAIGK
ncbi:MAG: ferredoxin [Bacteroidetes bacterium]|nr:ferredoxin [Bacteroidota bacterium]